MYTSHGIRSLFLYSALLFLLASCEEVVEKELVETIPPRLVIDAQFTSEPGTHFVKITRSETVQTDGPSPAVSNAVVSISDGENVYDFIETIPFSGFYLPEASLKGEAGKTYTLLVKVDGKIYTATEKMEAVSGVLPINNYRLEAQHSSFYLWDMPNIHSVNAGTSYEWHIILTPPAGGSMRKEVEFVYYNFTGLETSALFQLNEMSQTLRFEKGTTLTQKKYSLSSHYYNFLKAIYTETDWRGGLYDSTPANVPTNISNGALGYFKVSDVTSLSQVIQ